MSTERERLMKLMETEGMTAKQFATEVGIQAGTISNIVNGRNKPSLEVLQKVLHRFRTVSSDWMILDSGSMYRPVGEQSTRTLFDELPVEPPMVLPAESTENTPQTVGAANNSVPSKSKESPQIPQKQAAAEFTQPAKQIEKIVIFYSDGTYENFCH